MKKKYCASPWRGLHLNFEGQIKTCCASDPNMLSPRDDNNKVIEDNRTIENVMQSDIIKEVRASIKQGILHPKYCRNCIDNEEQVLAVKETGIII